MNMGLFMQIAQKAEVSGLIGKKFITGFQIDLCKSIEIIK